MNKVVFLKKHMTPLKRQYWQKQLSLPYNALEKRGTMTGKKIYIIECTTGETLKGKNIGKKKHYVLYSILNPEVKFNSSTTFKLNFFSRILQF